MKLKAILFLLIPLFILLSCIKSKDASKQQLVVWEQEDAAVAPFIDEMFTLFKNLPENKTVEIVRVHYNTEDLTQQFQTASIAGSPPDLIMSPSDTAGIFSISGFILPTNDLFDLSIYNQAIVDAISLNNKTWGIPISNGNHLMLFYNKKLVSAAPQTTDELFKYCEDNVKKLKHCMAMNMSEPFWLVPWLGAFGGWLIDNRTPTLNTPEMEKTLAFLVDLKFNKKYVPLECDYNCMDTLFKEEKVPFIINGDWALSTYHDHFKENFGVAKIPKLSSTGKWPTPMISGKYFMLSSTLKGEKLELAKKLVSFYTNKDNQIAQLRTLKRLPALKEAATADIISNSPLLSESMSQILVGRPMSMATEMRAMWDAMRPHLGNALKKKYPPLEAAQKMQTEAITKIKEMNL